MESGFHWGGSYNDSVFSKTTKPLSHSQVQGGQFMRLGGSRSGRSGSGQAADNIPCTRSQGSFQSCLSGKPIHLSSHLLSKTGSGKCWPAGAGWGHAWDFSEPAPTASWQLLDDPGLVTGLSCDQASSSREVVMMPRVGKEGSFTF